MQSLSMLPLHWVETKVGETATFLKESERETRT